jgi:hypothetical protein
MASSSYWSLIFKFGRVGQAANLLLVIELRIAILISCIALVLQMFVDNESLKRTSTLLMDKDILADARLMQALFQIEDLTKQLETLKFDSMEKVQSMIMNLAFNLRYWRLK